MSVNSTFDLTMLAPQREVTVVGEEHHQAALAHYAPVPTSAPRRLVAELTIAPIGRGTYAGRPGVQVRIDGTQVGELTFRMSQRYLPTVEAMIRARQRPGAHALVKYGRRGLIEVELRLPDERPGPVPIPAPRPGGRRTPPPPRPGPHPARRGRRWMWGAGAVLGTAVIIGVLGNGSGPKTSTPTVATTPIKMPVPKSTPGCTG